MFYSPTSCRNIQYQVHKVEGDTIKAICQLVKEKLEKYTAPSKIIVYSSSIKTIKELSSTLNCYIYYINIESNKEKNEI